MWQGIQAFCRQLCEETILELDLPGLVTPADDCRDSQQLDCNLWRDPEPEPLCGASPEFLSFREL